MALASAALIPLSLILVRTHLTEQFSWNHAGYWDAMWRISAVYLMFVTTPLTVYYLPRLSEIKNKAELRAELLNGFKVVIPIVMAMSLVIYLLRDLVVTILFTAEFAPVTELFFWQLLGDTLRICGWLLAYVMVARAMTKFFIISELVFTVAFYSLTLLFTSTMGFEGVTFAYMLSYLIYSSFVFSALKLKRVI